MLFSIVIPVYNVEKYINECLDSIIPQAIECKMGAEIILIDDGSKDSSGKICDDYQAKHGDLIKVIHKENEGLLLTRRRGFKHASGDYILNCDSDDKLEKGTLQSLETIINDKSPDVIFYNMNFYDGKKETLYYRDIFTSEKSCELDKDQVVWAYLYGESPVTTSMAAKVIKKSVLDIEKDYSPYARVAMGEDTLQSATIIANAETFMYLNEQKYIYRIGTGMSSSFDDRYYETFRDILQYISEIKNFKTNQKYLEWIKAAVVNTAGRAILQSKNDKRISYNKRKQFIKKILRDDWLNECLRYNQIKKLDVNKKCYVIVKLCKMKFYYVVHIALKIKGKLG